MSKLPSAKRLWHKLIAMRDVAPAADIKGDIAEIDEAFRLVLEAAAEVAESETSGDFDEIEHLGRRIAAAIRKLQDDP